MNKAAQALGRLGGKATSETKAAAVRENGKKGGRPVKPYRVTGDVMRMTYSKHDSQGLATKAAKALAAKWGWSHPGSEPAVERLTADGWEVVESIS